MHQYLWECHEYQAEKNIQLLEHSPGTSLGSRKHALSYLPSLLPKKYQNLKMELEWTESSGK